MNRATVDSISNTLENLAADNEKLMEEHPVLAEAFRGRAEAYRIAEKYVRSMLDIYVPVEENE